MSDDHLFVSCVRGLEPLLAEELAELGVPDAREGFCGVYVSGNSHELIYRLNYGSRLASRILLPLVAFGCHNRETLYKAALRVDWNSVIPQGRTFAIDANVSHEKLRHSLFAAQVVKDAICDQLREKRGERPSVQVRDPDVQLNLFVHDAKGVISLDTSGAPLHRRGYRARNVAAPLQETLGAAVLRLAGFRPEMSLCDPCAGGGTFLSEAYLMATRTPPAFFRRRFGFEEMAGFDRASWEMVRRVADDGRVAKSEARLVGCEVLREVYSICTENLTGCGARGVKVMCADFRRADLPRFDRIVTNPPHGLRLKGEEELYPQIGDFIRDHLNADGEAWLVIGEEGRPEAFGLKVVSTRRVSNGGQRCQIVRLSRAR